MYNVIAILNWACVGLSLYVLGGLLFRGQLREKALALGPERDLSQTHAVYHLGAMGVIAYVFLKLALGGMSRSEWSTAIDLLPMIMVGLLIGRMVRVDAGFRRVGLVPRHPTRDLRWAALAVPVALGLASVASLIAVTISAMLKQPTDQVAHETLRLLRDEFSLTLLITVILSAVILGPVIEEIVFRGILQTSLVQLTGGRRWPALILTAGLFSITHWWVIVSWQALLPLFVLGLVFGYVYERTGSLLTAVLTHAGFNAMNVAISLAIPMDAAG